MMSALKGFVWLFLAAITLALVAGNPSGRIVGGSDAVHKQFPYQISLRQFHTHICGGSIISTKYILTAAHCVVEEGIIPYAASEFTIRAGTHNRIAGGVIVQVKKVTVHQSYGDSLNDLALLELEKELVYSDTIQPIALEEEEVEAGSQVIISGWGLLVNAGASLPIILQWNTVTALSKSQCTRKIIFASEALICLDHPKGKGACNGDSGGPAVFDGKLVGVAGFVVLGCGSTRPDGYAKVSYNIKWIHEHMI